MRVLAVDPGTKNLGIAISDPTGTIANPLNVIKHKSRTEDAVRIAEIAFEYNAAVIIIGEALDDEGYPTSQSQQANRLAAEIRTKTKLPVELWDESDSTQIAQDTYRNMGVSRKKRKGHLDHIAATVILQSYLNAHNPPNHDNGSE